MQLMRRELHETLVAETKRSFDALARLGTRLAGIRASRSLTRMTVSERSGVAGLHGAILFGASPAVDHFQPCT
jgi:hypothetical protein